MYISMLIANPGEAIVQELCMVMMRWQKAALCIALMRKLTSKLSSDVDSMKNKL